MTHTDPSKIPLARPQKKTGARITVLALVFGMVLLRLTAHAQADCGQISPNPNPAGNTITNTKANACNESERYDNFGKLNNVATLENGGELRNFGPLRNTGTLINFGAIFNFLSRNGSVENSGTLNNYGEIGGRGSTNNTGIVNNYGTLDAGDFGENAGVVNNYPGSTLVGSQRYTSDGVVNNYPGATLRINVSGKNNGTLNNNGVLIHIGRFLLNNGTLNNNVGATLTTTNGLDNIGHLKNEGTLQNAGLIKTSGQLRISNSGSITGSGSYAQLAGATVVHGSITQAAVYIEGGLLSGNGSITAPVSLNGGTITHGEFPGKMTIVGDYTQSAISSFAAVIGAQTDGIAHGVLSVSGTATLDGLLDVRLYNYGGKAYSPNKGDSFDILRAETIVGTFSTILFVTLGDNLKWQVSYLTDAYNTTDVVRLSAVPVHQQAR